MLGKAELVDSRRRTSREARVSVRGTVGLIRRHRKEWAERPLMMGERWADLDLVCLSGDGAPRHPSELSHSFARYPERASESGVRRPSQCWRPTPLRTEG